MPDPTPSRYRSGSSNTGCGAAGFPSDRRSRRSTEKGGAVRASQPNSRRSCSGRGCSPATARAKCSRTGQSPTPRSFARPAGSNAAPTPPTSTDARSRPSKHGHRPPLAGVPEGRITLAEYGRPVQKRRKRARPCRAGCHSPRRPAHLPDDGPVMPSEIGMRGAHPCTDAGASGNCGGNTRPAAGGERTLMGPATTPAGPKSAYPPMRVQVLKRTNGRNVGKLAHDPAGTEDESRVTPGSQTTWPKPAAPASPLLGVLQEESNQQARRPVPATALPGRRLVKRIGALKPAERGRATPRDWRSRRPPGGSAHRNH